MPRIATLVAAVAVGTAVAALHAADTRTDWPSYNRTLTSERYAPLDQINKSNVSRLKQLCVYDLDVDVSFQAGPLVIGRTMYVTADRETLAIDALTCQQKWRVREEGASPALRVNRGAAYLDGRLFRGTGDGDLVAYDAVTGTRVWKTRLADPDKGESMPAAPIAWNGMVFIGTAGSERYGVTGRVYAVDAATGKQAWETYTVPTDAPQPGNETMQKQARATWGNAQGVPVTGGGTWTSYTIDPDRGLLYVPVGNPGPDFTTHVRPGDNLYTNSILVLDARTGVYRNHYSLVPADFHDWDLGAAPVVVTTKSGKRVVAGAPKDGLLHVYDLASNKKLYATPITTRLNDTMPLSTTPLRFCPGSSGGTEWNGPAFSPDTNLFYGGTADWCTTLAIEADGWLARVPFEALLDSTDRYLVERTSIVHSLGQDSQARLHSETSISKDLAALVVGSTASSATDGLVPLPDVAAEADTVAGGFHLALVLKGGEATLSAVRGELPGAAVFHFAGHSLAAPQRTGLLLQSGDGHANAPRLIDANMVRQLHLQNLQLAVLSACSTASGSGGSSGRKDRVHGRPEGSGRQQD